MRARAHLQLSRSSAARRARSSRVWPSAASAPGSGASWRADARTASVYRDGSSSGVPPLPGPPLRSASAALQPAPQPGVTAAGRLYIWMPNRTARKHTP